jgi:ABC-type antimicrobial peptide transport system permease subunit
MTHEEQKIKLVRTRITESQDINFRNLAKTKGTTTYQIMRQLICNYLNQNSQAV